MSDVGDLLELLHGAGDRWQTLRATVRNWHDTKLHERAVARWLEQERQGGSSTSAMVSFGATIADQRAEWDLRTRVWIVKPDRWRQESDWGTQVVRGGTWWSFTEQGLMTNENDPEVGAGSPLSDHAHLLEPAALIPALRFERIERVGEVLRVEAHPRERSPQHQFLFGLSRGADRYRLTVDANRGVVLRSESLLDGALFAISELLEPEFDVELPAETFELEVPAGETARSPRDLHASLTIEQAAARASFTVFAPAELPEGNWRLQAHYHAAMRGADESVHLLYHRADGRGWLTINEHEAGRELPWTRLNDAAHVEVERDGTAITLSSQTVDEDTLRTVAGTLEPV